MSVKDEARAQVDHWDEYGQGYKDGEMIVCICGQPYPLRDDVPGFERPHYCPADEEPEPELCPMGCGTTTEDYYGGPCAACWAKV